MNPLFQAHCPQRGYLTKLCDHSYCSILSVAELRRSPDQVVAPFTHSHAAYEFLQKIKRTTEAVLRKNSFILFSIHTAQGQAE